MQDQFDWSCYIWKERMIKTGDKNFWLCQASGWGTLALANFSVQLIAGYPLAYLLGNALLPFICGFLITSLYRLVLRKINWQKWSFKRLIILLIFSTLLLTSIFLILVFFISYILIDGFKVGIVSFLSNFFIFMSVMGLWNLIYFWIHYFNHWNQAEIEKWQLAAEMKDAQLGSLKSQINPHFVFNALNNIRALILEDPQKARHMLLNFSDLFRYSLKHSDQVKVELAEEIEIVNQYLELLSIQYEDKLRYEIQFEERLKEIQIPPMVLQLLVENAVKHGISQRKEGGNININISEKAAELLIRVRNSGRLKSGSKLGEKLGVGLKNISRRLELIYNGRARFEIYEEQESVIAQLNIPFV